MSMFPNHASLLALTREVASVMLASEETLVAAESCTGGWIGKCCTDLSGSSRWFRGGAVVYDNALKTGLTLVDPMTLERHGAVSEATVREMAAGALSTFGGTISVAVTGIAGPEGGTADKPVGTVWFAWGRKQNGRLDVTTTCHRLAGNRDAIRRQAVKIALHGVIDRCVVEG